MERVQKLMSSFCSRRKAEEYIRAGRVKVNGRAVSLGDQAEQGDKITVDGKPIPVQTDGSEKKVYIIFNKPKGCVTASTDKHEKTVMDYIRSPVRVFPVGRLDKDTTGLLILTNDGDFANTVMHPSREIEKTYVAKIDRHISKRDIAKLQQGVMLDDGRTAPAKVKMIDPTRIELTIHEGKNRIVRRMFESLGFVVKELERIKIGKLELKGLKPGNYLVMDKIRI